MIDDHDGTAHPPMISYSQKANNITLEVFSLQKKLDPPVHRSATTTSTTSYRLLVSVRTTEPFAETAAATIMGPYPKNNNRLFGQTMKKKPSSASSRYQRQFGNNNNNSNLAVPSEESMAERKAAEAVARRRNRQEQGEAIDIKFGYHRLEDQPQGQQQQQQQDEISATQQRRGWLFHMLATTVSLIQLAPHTARVGTLLFVHLTNALSFVPFHAADRLE